MSPARLLHSPILRFWASFCLLLALLLSSMFAVAVEKTTSSAATITVDAEYQKVADQCHRLLRNPSTGGKREEWLQVIQKLEQLYRKNPQSRIASSALHLTARLYQTMHQRFHQPADLDQATALFSNVVSLFSQSGEAAEALYALAQIEQLHGNLRGAAKTYYKIVQSYPLSSRKAQAEEQLRQLIVIAESLTARKQGRKPKQPSSASTSTAPAVKVKQKPQEKEKMVLALYEELLETPPSPAPKTSQPQPVVAEASKPAPALLKPVTKPAVSSIPVAKEPEKPARQQITFAMPQVKVNIPPVPTKKPPEKITVPLSVTPPPKAAAAVKDNEPKKSLLAEISFPDLSFPFFGNDEEEKAVVTPKAAVQVAPKLDLPKPVPPPVIALSAPKIEPPKMQVASPPLPEKEKASSSAEKQVEQSKIVVSALKIASLEPEKPAPPTPKPPPQVVVAPFVSKPEPPKLQPLPVKIEIKSGAAKKAPLPAMGSFLPTPTLPDKKEEPKPALTELLPIQHWSSDSYSRVAVSASGTVFYHAELPDKNSGHPRQLRLEFKQSHVAPELRTLIAVENGLVKSIRAEQTDAETVRVSLELADAADCKIFSLNDPFRVVVDVRPLEKDENTLADSAQQKLTEQEKQAKATAVKKKLQIKPVGADQHDLTLAQQLGLSIRRIMIDPGHGGKDSGATGFGLQEKDIVLDVAKRVKTLLEKEKYEVPLTRDKDVFIALEERTAIANTKGADLFLSIHVNAHPKPWVKGVETFYLNLAANPEAMRVAALENATSSRSMSEMQGILADLMKNTKIDESSLLAEFIQTSMADGLRQYKIKSLGVKKAPFYVLIGAQMPAALSEISFISNKDEAALLKDDKYLQALAEQIAAGVIAYIEHRRPATNTTQQ
ncbi:N-acetylmuramoyl-L-alanine amidase [Desulfobulbus sp. F5]|nr:N-acetylmuramoyl-L-alanine amidase [Desulfobulbus sp. F5]